jgi:hypothetical protein
VAAFDTADEVALALFAAVLAEGGHGLETATPEGLSDALGKLGANGPAVVLIGSLGPGGLRQARDRVRQVRDLCPTARLVVGRWGRLAAERDRERLEAAGADHVGASFAQTWEQVKSCLGAGVQ